MHLNRAYRNVNLGNGGRLMNRVESNEVKAVGRELGREDPYREVCEKGLALRSNWAHHVSHRSP